MRVIAYQSPQPITSSEALLDLEMPQPVPDGHDLLVEVKAVSVNPVDVKIRKNVAPAPGTARTIGWDAAGIVAAVGPEVTLFKPGDAVYYAGAIDRPGSNAQFQLVDERIVGAKPATLDFAQAAAMPLTSITAWEALFDRLDIRRAVPGAANAVVIIGAAGGVGSMAIQLIRALTDLQVIATASRDESREWVRQLGAHHVIDHSKPLAPQIAALGLGQPGFVFSITHTADHLPAIGEFIAPQGRLAVIDDPKTLDIMPLKRKSVSVHWEFMFTRSLFGTADIAQQHALLNEVARLVDGGKIQTTLRKTLQPIQAATLRAAHALVESDHMVGKVVIQNWP